MLGQQFFPIGLYSFLKKRTSPSKYTLICSVKITFSSCNIKMKIVGHLSFSKTEKEHLKFLRSGNVRMSVPQTAILKVPFQEQKHL